MLDWLIVWEADNPLSSVSGKDCQILDHNVVFCNVKVQAPERIQWTIMSRRLEKISLWQFQKDIKECASSLVDGCPDSD